MKILHIYITVICAIIFSACTSTEVARFPPEIQIDSISAGGVNLRTDSISSTGELILDSVDIGVLTVFSLKLNGFYNNLDSFHLSNSDTSAVEPLYVKKNLDDNFSKSKSDFYRGNFVFLPGKNSNSFLFGYKAKKSTNSLLIRLILFSNVVFDDEKLTNADTVNLKMVIK